MKSITAKRIPLLIALALFSATAVQADPPAPTAAAPIVFFDIAGPDAAALKQFYSANFGWSINGANAIKTPALEGTLRQDPAEKIIYIGVADINASLKAIVASGGSVVIPRSVVPNVVIFALFKDPAGNRMGLVEIKR
jgi:predicted enzyme related to lactoylglutathione lyase